MAKRVTIKDIARELGVTPTTVSMVIHNNKSIPPRTRAKVLAAIKEMKYYPNYTARSLVSGKTNRIAILSDFFYPPFFQQLLKGIEYRLLQTSFQINHYASLGDNTRKQRIIEEIVFGRQADCLITFNVVPPADLLDALRENQFPLIILESDVAGVHSIYCDNFKGGYLAARFLIERGREDIVVVTGDPQVENNVESRRLAGCRKALAEQGRGKAENDHFVTAHHTPQDTMHCFEEILKHKRPPFSIFCAAGDTCALGIMYAARKAGLRIPQDLALLGYDDQELSAFLCPPLTTVKQPALEMGRSAVEIALECLQEDYTGKVHKLSFEPELIVRQSV